MKLIKFINIYFISNYFKHLLFLVFLCFICINVFPQDIHFTQFAYTPLNLNPAQTGLFEGSHRFALNQRTQWRSVTKPYSTVSASTDMHVMMKDLRQNIFGVGLVINRDKAGDSEFGTTQFLLSLSFIRAMDRKGTQLISIGFQTGITQRTINYQQLKFDTQYDGFQYDPNLDNTENFKTKNFFYPDASAGINYRYQPKRRLIFNMGLAAFHLNAPAQSFFEKSGVKLNPRFTGYIINNIELSHDFDILPSIQYQLQGTYQELLFGAALKTYLGHKQENYSAIYTGIYCRGGDALMASVGMDNKRVYAGISYDVNISKLTPASNLLGGLEIAINYKLDKIKSIKVPVVACPIF